ncbi:MAG TPA: hypothetical protein VJ783_04590, partial [Pirellulales bacterium]|nr:hypothetical protein [Pirellulales bacterium]
LTAYTALLHEQDDYLKVLIQIAGDKRGPPGTRYHAVRLLGDLASPRAVRVLVENIDWQFPGELDIVTESTGLEGYPCAMALRRCGINCLPEILLGLSKRSADELTDKMIETRASVLSEVYDAGVPIGGEGEAIALIERFLTHVLPLSASGNRENVERLLVAMKKTAGRAVPSSALKAPSEAEFPSDACGILDRVANLSAPDFEARQMAQQALLQCQRDYLTALMKVAGDRLGPPGARSRAVTLLGDLLSNQAVPMLVENIDWQFTGEPDGVRRMNRLQSYPCAMALSRHGVGCVPTVLLSLARKRPGDLNDKMLERRALLLRQIYAPGLPLGGYDEAITAAERFSTHVIQPNGTANRENIERLVAAMKKLAG